MQTDRERELGADRQGKGNLVQTDRERELGADRQGKGNSVQTDGGKGTKKNLVQTQ